MTGKISERSRLMRKLKETGLVIVFDLVADITILLFCAACLIDIAYKNLENALLALVDR